MTKAVAKARAKAKGHKPARKMHDEEKPGLGPDAASDLKELEDLAEYIIRGMDKFGTRVRHQLGSVQLDRMTAPQLTQAFILLRAMGDVIGEATKPVGELTGLLSSTVIPEAFERESISSFTTDNGYRVTVSQRFFASILEGMKDVAFEWLRKNKLGDLIQPTVNAGTLSAEGKRMLEEGRELPEQIFSTHYKPSTSLTKVAKK